MQEGLFVAIVHIQSSETILFISFVNYTFLHVKFIKYIWET